MRRNEWIGLVLVLILAAGMRLYRADSVEFYHDEAMVGMLAQEMAVGQTFPLQGIVSSVGIPNPPQTIYTVLPPFWFSNNPVVVTGWVILLNIIGVGLLYVVTLRQFGLRPALLAAAIYAVNPWAVMYSRKLWAQDYTSPFLLLSLLLAQLGFRDGKRWAQVLTAPVMLWGMQIHFAAWALVPLFGWIMLAGRKRWRWRSLILSAILSLLVLTPFILGIIQTLSQDPSRIRDSLAASAGRDLDGGLSPWVDWLRLLTGQGVETWMRPNESAPLLWVGIFLAPALLTALWVLWRRYGWGVWGAFALWLILPPLAFDLVLSDVWPHYFIPLLPGFAMLIGLAADIPLGVATNAPVTGTRNGESAKKFSILFWIWVWGMRGAVVLALLTMMLNWLAILGIVLEFKSTIGAGTSGYTTPSNILNRIADSIPREINDVVVLTQDMDFWFDSEAARWPVMLRDVAACVRALPRDGYAVLPSKPFVVLTTPDGYETPLILLYQNGVQTTRIDNRVGAKPYGVEIFESAPVWDGAPITDLATPVRFDNNVLLTGYGFVDGMVYLRWSLPDAPDRRFYESRAHDVQFFAHILDSAGSRLGQLDMRFWQARHWCAGDTLYTWGDLPGADSATVLRVGFYRLGTGVDSGQTFPLNVLDPMGNPAGNWTDVKVK